MSLTSFSSSAPSATPPMAPPDEPVPGWEPQAHGKEGNRPRLVRDIVLARICARARRRCAWIDHLRGHRVSGVVAREDLELALCNGDSVAAEAAWREGQPALRAVNREIAEYERALEADRTSALAQLAHTFELDADERDVVQVLWATALEPSLSKVWAHLHGHANLNYPSVSLVGRLFDKQDPFVLAHGGALVQWDLVRMAEVGPGDPAPLSLDPPVLELLSSGLGLDPILVGRAEFTAPQNPPGSWPLGSLVAEIRRALGEGHGVRVTLVGPERSGRRTLAACISSALGARALAIDTNALSDSHWQAIHLRAQRQALLLGTSLVWHGERVAGRFATSPGQVRLQFVIGDVELSLPPSPGLVDIRVVMPALSLDERHAAWRRLVPTAQAWSEAELGQIVDRYRVQIGDIASLGERQVKTAEEARSGCRELTRHRLGDLGQLIETPFRRSDLTLPACLDHLLDSFLYEARERSRFWENPVARRLFPRGTGLIALMTGPPGTGKTMTAQVVAAELGLDLVRIDLASTVNKYIGETAKNLRRIFARAAEMNAVLLFDEADALFAKRTDVRDAHDRHANADTNYLLQKLEDFDGIALLASNRKQNMDSAFIRRIRYIMDFPRPRPPERRTIWTRLARELVGEKHTTVIDPLLRSFADLVDLSGAQIKLALLGAIFCAKESGRPLGLEHLHCAVERELAKEGRAGEIGEKERFLPHA